MTQIEITTKITLDIETAAKWFAALSDDEMCRFLVAVAAEAEQYDGCPDNQWYYLGGHLRHCKCSSRDAREMIKAWNYWMENSEHGVDGR